MGYGIRVFLDDTEVDCSSIGRLSISTGEFKPLAQGTPHVATLDTFPGGWNFDLAQVIHCTIVMTLPAAEAPTTAPTGVYVNAGAANRWEWCIFQGTIASRRGVGPNLYQSPAVTLNFAGDMSNVLNRRPHSAANANTNYRQALNAHITDLGLSNTGYDGFPSDLYQMDAPAEGTTSSGEYLRTIGAPHGCWVTCTWDWAGTTPAAMVWRPSYFMGNGVTTTRRTAAGIGQPWLMDFPTTGINYDDLVAKIEVQGTAGTTGSAQLATSAERLAVGNRTANIDSWIDNNGGCGAAAQALLDRVGVGGTANYLGAVSTYLDSYYQRQLAAGVSTATTKLHTFYCGFEKVADLMFFGGGSPSPPAFAAAIQTQIDYLVQYSPTGYQICTGFTKTWTPTGGWMVLYTFRDETNPSP